MTADVELLPLPEGYAAWCYIGSTQVYSTDEMESYARVNVAHATAQLQAEIEALRVEVAAQRTRADAMAGEAIKHEARAERLAEALREIEAIEDEMEGGDWDEIEAARKIATAALHPTAAQEDAQ